MLFSKNGPLSVEEIAAKIKSEIKTEEKQIQTDLSGVQEIDQNNSAPSKQTKSSKQWNCPPSIPFYCIGLSVH